MTTLIAAYNSEGCTGRCDARCYDATEPECNCICGGLNHGKGLQGATDNTQRLAESWISAWQQTHPDFTRAEVPGAQLALPLSQ